MVVMVTSCAHSLHYRTQQDFINTCTLPIYTCHTLLKPLLFWKGDTDELNAKTKGSDRIPTKKSLV